MRHSLIVFTLLFSLFVSYILAEEEKPPINESLIEQLNQETDSLKIDSLLKALNDSTKSKPKRKYIGRLLWDDLTINRESPFCELIDNREIQKSHARDIEEIFEFYGYPILRRNYVGTNSDNDILISGMPNEKQYTLIDNIPVRSMKHEKIYPNVIPFSAIDEMYISNVPTEASMVHSSVNYRMMRYTPGTTFTDFYINMADYNREAIGVRANISYFEPLEMQVAIGQQTSKLYVFAHDINDFERKRMEYSAKLGYRLSPYHRFSISLNQTDFDDFYYSSLGLMIADARMEGRFEKFADYLLNYRYEDFSCISYYETHDGDNPDKHQANETNAVDIKIKPFLFYRPDTNTIDSLKAFEPIVKNPQIEMSYISESNIFDKINRQTLYIAQSTYSLVEDFDAFSLAISDEIVSKKIYLKAFGAIRKYSNIEELSGHVGLLSNFRIINGCWVNGAADINFFDGNVGYYHCLSTLEPLPEVSSGKIKLGVKFDRLNYLSFNGDFFASLSYSSSESYKDYSSSGIHLNANIKPIDFAEIDIDHWHFNNPEYSNVEDYINARCGFDFFLLHDDFQVSSDVYGRIYLGLQKAEAYFPDDPDGAGNSYTIKATNQAHWLGAQISGEYKSFEMFIGVDNITSQKIALLQDDDNDYAPMQLPRNSLPQEPIWQFGVNWILID